MQLRVSPSLSKCGVENLESLFGSDKFADVVRVHRRCLDVQNKAVEQFLSARPFASHVVIDVPEAFAMDEMIQRQFNMAKKP